MRSGKDKKGRDLEIPRVQITKGFGAILQGRG